MSKNFRFASLVLSIFFCFSAVAFGQETGGRIEVTVRDPQGAVIPNVSVTVTSSRTDKTVTAGFRRTLTTNEEGSVRLLEVPPGVYDVIAAPTGGFQERTIQSVQVILGKTTPVTVDLGVASATATVDINSENVSAVDVTDTKIQTSITAQTAELLPKGTNFSSLLKVSPATRPEPLSGGFQVDGASGSENTFIVDGQEVTNVRTGVLNTNSNLPFQLVQEIQIKSSGFEAEFGGATGGVINVVTKGGGNDIRGEFGFQFESGKLQARGRPTLIENTAGLAEYVQPNRDGFLGFYPTANLSGPIIKDRLWFFGSYTPQLFTRSRTIDYINPTTRALRGVENYDAKQTNEYAFARLDAQPFSRLRLNSTYTWNPIIQRGFIPGYSTLYDAIPTGNNLSGAAYQSQVGGRQNSQSVTGAAVYTPTDSLIISLRGGHYFLNEKLGTYGRGDVTRNRLLCSGSSTQQFPAAFGCVRGQSNGVTAFSNTLYDATTRNTFDGDVTFITSFLGRHELKGGYQYNGIGNKLLSQDTDQIVLRYGQSIAAYSGRNIPSAPGAVGSGSLIRYRESGDVSSTNTGIYIQDRYQPFTRLSLNLGLRAEREDVPSFDPRNPGLKFNFQDKIAPRLGVAYDVTGDGKTKVSAFYGWFYDRFKYELPRGSFGGAFYRQDFFEIFPGDNFGTFTPSSILGGSAGDTIGGVCPSTTTPVYGRVRCQLDFRVPSNSGLGVLFGSIDPDIKAFRQSELTFTAERDLGSNFVLQGRFTRKNVDRTIEDAGFFTPNGSESYVIGNPGTGLHGQLLEAAGLVPLKPKRLYQAFEVRLDRRFANNYYFNANYTYSRLTGNYSGLASSDEDGRVSPNVNRYFDLPHAGFTAAGGPDNGVLATDRPHVFKFYGAYSLDWGKAFGFGSNNTTEFSGFTTIQSGTPVTTLVDIYGIDTIVLNGRGDLGRTEKYTASDFAIRHRYRFGRDNRFTLVGEIDVLNIFNEANELNRFNLLSPTNFDLSDPSLGLLTAAESQRADAELLAISRFQRNGALNTLTTQANADRDPRFNLPSAFQGPREVRFGFRLLF